MLLVFARVSVCVFVDALLPTMLVDDIVHDPILGHLLDGVAAISPLGLIMASQVLSQSFLEFLGGAHAAFR